MLVLLLAVVVVLVDVYVVVKRDRKVQSLPMDVCSLTLFLSVGCWLAVVVFVVVYVVVHIIIK